MNTENSFESLLSKMTIEEKVTLCHAATTFKNGSVERLGIPSLNMSDGPHGVRAEVSATGWESAGWTDDAVTYLPVLIALGASWDKELAFEYGVVLGKEARSRDKDIMLGPGVNIIRTPLGGRNFEYLSEDPCLSGMLATGYIKGLQTQDVAACVKHYALNNQELDRFNVNIEVSDRALHEIYLPAFKRAVQDAQVLTIMGAYNKFRGDFCCHNDLLLNKILKRDWGFQGTVISDWGGVHDTKLPVLNGLDIEMGGPFNEGKCFLDKPFLEGLKNGTYSIDILNDKIRRILFVLDKIGMLGSKERSKGERNSKTNQEVAKIVAKESMVLLKNNNQILPLNRKQIKTIAVIGANATKLHARGGGSSGVKALYEISQLDGIKNASGGDIEVLYHQGYPVKIDKMDDIPIDMLGTADQTAGIKGWRAEFYNNRYGDGAPEVRIVQNVNFSFDNDEIVPGIGMTNCSVKYKATLSVPESGTFEFGIRGKNCTELYIDKKLMIAIWESGEDNLHTVTVELEKNRVYNLEVRIIPKKNKFNVHFGRIPQVKNTADQSGELQSIVKKADVVLFCGGLTHHQESEGMDRLLFNLPDGQDSLINEIFEMNKNLVVILTGGSPVKMPWVDQVPAIIQSWYAGSEGGNALGELLFGDACFCGKLPVTFPKDLHDSPAHIYGEYQAGNCEYKDDLLVGYRYFDTKKVEPLFPFGHGLSYTSFEYSNLQIDTVVNGNFRAQVTCVIRNTGKVEGKEVVQLYVKDNESSLFRPEKELKDFCKVSLQPNESKTVTFNISQDDLSFYDPQKGAWICELGEFTILLGSSSRDIRLQGKLTIA